MIRINWNLIKSGNAKKQKQKKIGDSLFFLFFFNVIFLKFKIHWKIKSFNFQIDFQSKIRFFFAKQMKMRSHYFFSIMIVVCVLGLEKKLEFYV